MHVSDGVYYLLHSPGGCSPGKCIPLLGWHRETLTLTGTKTKKTLPLLAHNLSRNPYPAGTKTEKGLPSVAQLEEN